MSFSSKSCTSISITTISTPSDTHDTLPLVSCPSSINNGPCREQHREYLDPAKVYLTPIQRLQNLSIRAWNCLSTWRRHSRSNSNFDPVHSTVIELSDYEKGLKECISAWIACTFDFGVATYSYRLDYSVYRKWNAFDELLVVIQRDVGVSCICIWDAWEGMETGAGDWEARVRPGWDIVVIFGDCVNAENRATYVESNKTGLQFEDRVEDDEWWFLRWRRRVERKRESYVKGNRGWLIGLLGMLVIAVSLVVVARWI